MLNIAYEAVDRHAQGARAGRVALRCLPTAGAPRSITYGELARRSNRYANLLRMLGVEKGDIVLLLCGRIPELHAALLGALKCGAVAAPLFTAFGPGPLATRVNLARGKVLVTTTALFERRVKGMAAAMPTLQHVVRVDGDDTARRVAAMSEAFAIERTTADDLAFVHFTSGTTGLPKGALHVHGAVLAHQASAAVALDLRADDVFWCTADPGWVTGTSYGIVAPLVLGATSVVDEGDFDPARWYRVLREERVNVWYTAPTAIRLLMKAAIAPPRLPDLRFVATVGEALNREAVWWAENTLGVPIHDNWWQTETGSIMIANTPAAPIRPGAMGKPLPGVEAAIVRRDDGGVSVLEQAEAQGELALRAGWPSMFRGYLGDDERYRSSFRGGWYLTGDLARRDADGYYWFVGRADDLIKSAGHLIGPCEVERVLMEHPAVAEAAAVGKPDALAGETVKAFVTLKAGLRADDALRAALLAHARRRLGAATAPKEIEFSPGLPHTRSGKILRRLLKAREAGVPAGDLSTLEAA